MVGVRSNLGVTMTNDHRRAGAGGLAGRPRLSQGDRPVGGAGAVGGGDDRTGPPSVHQC
jgi:hypothetical protein